MLGPRIRVAVLGGGFQGACVALELAARGVRCDLYERNADCLNEASRHNYGKIHLGFGYAKDPSLETARLMARGALGFERALQRWIGSTPSLTARSSFAYAVHRDGLVDADAFEAHCKKVSGFLSEASHGKGADYFGSDVLQTPDRMSRAELNAEYERDVITGAIRTPEIAIDPEVLAKLMRAKLDAEAAVSVFTGRTVTHVKPAKQGLSVESSQAGAASEEVYDFVVNTLGPGRFAVDAELGLKPRQPWLYRFRYLLRAEADPPQRLRSTTIVSGPYGDIVSYGGGAVCLSWYPADMVATSKDLTPPPLPAQLTGTKAAELRDKIVAGLSGIIPDLGSRVKLAKPEITGGWMVNWGDTDIMDPRSEIHRPFTVGVHRHGPYVSVDTGKLTLAPLFAEQAVRLMEA
jgi:glycine/D-amino acid oxidase-like deaminating enzyme